MKRGNLRAVALAMGLLFGLQLALPPAAPAITLREEEELGREFMKAVRGHFRIIHDPFIEGYVNEVGQKVLATMPPQPFDYQFFVIRQEVYNAFAGPAAKIFIHSGLMEAMETEDELAGILAHEIIHVSARHISQKIERSTALSLGALAGMVAGIFLGAAGAGAAANAVAMGGMAATQSAGLAYSRQDEMQADELGIDYLTRAGYSGEGLLRVLEKIREKQWFGADVPTYLMTHPAVDDRIAYLDGWIDRRPDAPKLPERDETFRRVKIRLIAGYSPPERALREMTERFESNPEDPVIQHGYGIALARNDQNAAAVDHVRKALAKRPLDPVLLKDMGEIYFMGGHYEKARDALAGSLGMAPEDFETRYLLGRTDIELKQYGQAVRTLEQLLKQRPEFSPALYHLGEAYGRRNRMGEAHYYLGRYYAGRKEGQNARFHLRKAIRLLENDPVRREEMETLLAQVNGEIAAERAEPIRRPRPTSPRPGF
ncbi:MAG: M48 family metalloprotease [Thermodesulfobacteriota bacterium]